MDFRFFFSNYDYPLLKIYLEIYFYNITLIIICNLYMKYLFQYIIFINSSKNKRKTFL